MATRIVCDNGSGALKIGFSSSSAPKLLPNAIFKAKHVRTRSFISSQLDECKDLSGIFYVLPFQKGYCVNLELERQIWEYAFTLLIHERTKDKNTAPDFSEYSLVLSEPLFNFTVIGEASDEIMFEEFGFSEVSRVPAPFLSAQAYKHDAKLGKTTQHQTSNAANAQQSLSGCLVVDSGYSFTHIVPVVDDRIVSGAVRRIDIGGKQLTNHLKELISYRYLNVLDETHVINQCKEDCCYVATDFNAELHRAQEAQYSSRQDNVAGDNAQKSTVCEYVLPDFSALQRGFMREPRSRKAANGAAEQQAIRLNNERFSVPELLFRPNQVGLAQAGISECLGEHVLAGAFAKRPATRELLARNVVLTGGNCLFSGLRDRVHADVRSTQPCEVPVNVYQPANAQTYAWLGGKVLVSASEYSELYKSVSVKKSEYEEIGSNICRERFASVYHD